VHAQADDAAVADRDAHDGSFYDVRAGTAMLRAVRRAATLAVVAVVIGVVPVGLLSATYEVVADGVPQGRIEHRILSMRDEASIVTPGGTFNARRERVFRAGAVLVAADGSVRAKAERERTWREHYRVSFGDTAVYLRQKPFSFSGLFLVSDDSGGAGSIRLERLFSRRLALEFAAAVPPLEIVAFLAWIVLMVQRRQSAE
jgi:hypothetical protein